MLLGTQAESRLTGMLSSVGNYQKERCQGGDRYGEPDKDVGT